MSNIVKSIDATASIGGSISGATQGSVLFAGAAGMLAQDNANLFFNDTNNSFSIGRNSLHDAYALSVARNSDDAIGTVSNSAGGTTVTGVGTKFLSIFQNGDKITAGSETRTILSLASNTSLTTDTWTGANSGVAYVPSSLGAGRITTTAGGITVTGTSTTFLAQFAIGDTLRANGETRTVASITSNSSMTTDAWIGANTTVSYEVFRKLILGIGKYGNLFFGNSATAFTSGAFNNRIGYDLVDAGTITAFNSSVVASFTSASTSTANQVVGGSYSVTVGPRNTQNWTSDFAASGISGQTNTNSGATGTITSMKGGRFNATNQSATITVTNAYGIYIHDNFQNTGTITNTYGAYVGDLTSGTQTNTPYSFYASDANAYNYFAGRTGIGTTAPLSTLDISGSVGQAIVNKTSTYTATASDYMITCDATGGAITINLPAASGATRRIYIIKKVDASVNTVTIDANASETIDGATTKVIVTQYASYTIQCDGATWWVQ